jgi:hypothetical protein
MHYIDYSTVKITHTYKLAQFAQEAEAGLIARQVRGSSPTLKVLARQKLGDGLITIGNLLKGSSISRQNAEPCR